MFPVLNETNFTLHAAHFYQNPQCMSEDEFQDDLSRIKNIHRLFSRYENTGDIKERLVLNHLVVLYNVFERDALTRMLCFRLRKFLPILKPFLVFLSYWPVKIVIDPSKDVIKDSDIALDPIIVETLRKI